jgi:hypothetical protein
MLPLAMDVAIEGLAYMDGIVSLLELFQEETAGREKFLEFVQGIWYCFDFELPLEH